MLTQIYVKNFILMDEVQLELHDNMSAFTGETGAGKSLLMDAIGILKGDRVNSDMIKAVSYTHLDVYKRQVLCFLPMPDAVTSC